MKIEESTYLGLKYSQDQVKIVNTYLSVGETI